MCGILFLISDLSYDEIKEYFSLIKYRGPDNTTLINIDNLYFGHHRLSIINPNSDKDNQPFQIQDWILLVNGEIYNYIDICNKYSVNIENNDCLSILSSYIRNNIDDTLDEIDGDYAFILYNKITKELISGRDHIGLKPLFLGYDKDNNLIGICSESKVLSKIDNIVNIEQQLPGEIIKLNIDNNNIERHIHKYKIPIFNGDIYISEIESLLNKSVKKRIEHTHQPLALLCSGGIDSSIILASAVKLFPNREFEVFSIEFTGNGISYDTIHAKLLMDNFPHIKHTIVKFSPEEGINAIKDVIELFETYDINTIRAGIPMYLLAKYIANNTSYKVILSGEGADELFLGYEYFTKRIGQYTGNDARDESNRLLDNLYSFDILRAERSFSSNGLELRVPFLDRDFIQYIKTIPGDLLIPRNGIEKYILREAYKEYKIPDRILWRQKERFSDGIGYGWVPELIKYCKDKNGEDIYFKDIYNIYYKKCNIILPRKIPNWCKIDNNKSMLGI